MSELESATKVLTRAVDLDTNQRYKEALVCYQEGTNLLMLALKKETDSAKRLALRQKLDEYLSRGEVIKPLVQNLSEKHHERVEIKDGERGHSYQKIFGKCLVGKLTEVRVEDPYIRTHYQIQNFVRFCELLVHVSSMKTIKLLTGMEQHCDPFALPQILINTFLSTGRHQDRSMQTDKFQKLADSLVHSGITLDISYSDTLHDREITFDNGWVVKIGRGLDMFKAVKDNCSVGHFDQSLRACHETTIDLYKNS